MAETKKQFLQKLFYSATEQLAKIVLALLRMLWFNQFTEYTENHLRNKARHL